MTSSRQLPDKPVPSTQSAKPRTQIDERIALERNFWIDLMDCIATNRRQHEIVEGSWDLHRLLSHLVIWRDRTLGVIAAQALGRPRRPDPWPDSLGEDVDEINRWLSDQPLDQSPAELIDRYTESFDVMQRLADDLTDEQLIDPALVPFMEGQCLADAICGGLLFGHLHV